MSNQSTLKIGPGWRRSSRCNNGNCVEVALLSDGMVGVRDTKNPNSPILRYTPDQWAAFVGQIVRGG